MACLGGLLLEACNVVGEKGSAFQIEAGFVIVSDMLLLTIAPLDCLRLLAPSCS
jgi:hypothetical protein